MDTPTDWVSSLVVVKKPNGKLKICIDPKPLNKALKRNHYPLLVDWQWTDTQEEAFAKIKKAVTQTPDLRYFNSEDETTLQCDASDTGLGATLMQKGQPVAFASRVLTPNREKLRAD